MASVLSVRSRSIFMPHVRRRLRLASRERKRPEYGVSDDSKLRSLTLPARQTVTLAILLPAGRWSHITGGVVAVSLAPVSEYTATRSRAGPIRGHSPGDAHVIESTTYPRGPCRSVGPGFRAAAAEPWKPPLSIQTTLWRSASFTTTSRPSTSPLAAGGRSGPGSGLDSKQKAQDGRLSAHAPLRRR